MARSYKRRLPATGRWIFVSNTGIWSADRFLEDGDTDLYFAVSHHHSQDIIAGDRGFLRLNDDKRRVEQRAVRPKVRAGVYAQVEVTGSPRFMADPDARYYVQPAAQSAKRWRVPVRVIGNYLQNPLLVSDLPDDLSLQHLRRPLPTAQPFPFHRRRSIE